MATLTNDLPSLAASERNFFYGNRHLGHNGMRLKLYLAASYVDSQSLSQHNDYTKRKTFKSTK